MTRAEKITDEEIRNLFDEYNKLSIKVDTMSVEMSMRPCLVVGEYEISKYHHGSFWIRHDSGEGMEVSHEALSISIHKFYKENF